MAVRRAAKTRGRVSGMTVAWRRVRALIGFLRPSKDEARGLSLRLEPATLVRRPNQKLTLTAYLTNHGPRPLTLVLPGDGSRMGRRNPVVEWLFTPGGKLSGFEGCGNINELKAGEVFTLQPGETRELHEWVAPLAWPTARRFSAVMVYSNQPDLPFQGVILRPHDERELARLRKSDRCRVLSNEIEIFVEDSDVA
jgi:hypothetical protein